MKKTIAPLLFLLFAFLQNAYLFSEDSLLVWSKWLPDVYSVRFSPDNTKISLLKDFSDIIILKIPSGEVEDTLKGVGHGEYTQDGKYLICGSDKLRVFDAYTYEQLNYFENDNKEVSEVSIAPDNKICSRHGGSGFRIWDFNTGKIIKRKSFGIIDSVKNISEGIIELAYTKDGKYLIVNKGLFTTDPKGIPILLDQYIMILDPNTLDSVGVINTGKQIKGMALSKTGRYVAYSLYGKRVRIVDLNNNLLIFNVAIDSPFSEGMDFSPDDRYIGFTEGGSDIYNINDKKRIYTYNTGTPWTMAFSNDNNYIFVSADYVYLYKLPWITSVSIPKNIINATIIYPNPADQNISILFDLPKSGNVSINIVDNTGVGLSIFNGYLDSGNKKIEYSTTGLSNGIYYIQIQSEDYRFTYKLIINR